MTVPRPFRRLAGCPEVGFLGRCEHEDTSGTGENSPRALKKSYLDAIGLLSNEAAFSAIAFVDSI